MKIFPGSLKSKTGMKNRFCMLYSNCDRLIMTIWRVLWRTCRRTCHSWLVMSVIAAAGGSHGMSARCGPFSIPVKPGSELTFYSFHQGSELLRICLAEKILFLDIAAGGAERLPSTVRACWVQVWPEPWNSLMWACVCPRQGSRSGRSQAAEWFRVCFLL